MEVKTEVPALMSDAEARELTLQLGRSYYGDRYSNPDIYGLVANFDLRPNDWKVSAYAKDPEPFDRAIREQLERSQAVIAPHIGRAVVGKTTNLVMRKPDETWEEWKTPAPFFAEGTIASVEGQPARRRQFFDLPAESMERLAKQTQPSYRIGVVIDLTEPLRNNNQPRGIETPNTERVLVPIRPFPKARVSLFSDQLTAIPEHRR